MAGLIRRFADPMNLEAASSPAHAGDDPIRFKATTTNFLMGNTPKLNVERLSASNLFWRQQNVPGLSLGSGTQSTPFTDVPIPGDKLTFKPLVVRFVIAEDLSNFIEIHRWMRMIGFPEAGIESAAARSQIQPDSFWRNFTSDASQTFMTNNGSEELVRVHYKNVFPVDLDDIDNEGSDQADPYTSSVTFLYKSSTLELIPGGTAP